MVSNLKMAAVEEYSSLRAEILQIYEQQFQLAIVQTIAVAALLGGVLIKSDIAAAILAAVLLFLYAITLKSIANYHRIYRIGSYLAVVHEGFSSRDQGTNSLKGSYQWHSLWRILASKENFREWGGGQGCEAEARFIRIIAGVIWLITIIIAAVSIDCDAATLKLLISGVLLILSGVLTVFLFKKTNELIDVGKSISVRYEDAWKEMMVQNEVQSNEHNQ